MKRYLFVGACTAALTAGLLGSPLSAAPKATTVVEDPINDANFINDQGQGDGSFGNVETPADVSSVTDFEAVTIAHDSKNVYVNFETEAAAPATQGVGYRLRLNPDGATYCVLIEVFYPGATTDLTAAEAHVRDACAGGDPVPVKTLGNMIVIPRKAHKAFGPGQVLKAPQAHGFVYSGSSYPAGIAYPVADTTTVGKDYKLN